ncbi:MAG: helix-turn-helix domain-containing protein [Chloroflexi bacterium]|nr:helix-turn-helix domain-containing protein [Chloroflexota bacterium]
MSSKLIARVKAEYYTLGEAAQCLHVSSVTIWRWIKDGRLKAERIGREVLVQKNAVHALRKSPR